MEEDLKSKMDLLEKSKIDLLERKVDLLDRQVYLLEQQNSGIQQGFLLFSKHMEGIQVNLGKLLTHMEKQSEWFENYQRASQERWLQQVAEIHKVNRLEDDK